MTWRGNWSGDWVGDWQGGQEASPFANMAMRSQGAATVVATLDADQGAPTYADMALLAQGTGALAGELEIAQRVFADAQCIALGGGTLVASLRGADVVQLPAPGGGSSRRRPRVLPWPAMLSPQQIKDRRRRRQEAEVLALEAM